MGFVAGRGRNRRGRHRFVWSAGTSIVTRFLEVVRGRSDASKRELWPPCFDAGATRDVTDLEKYAGALREVLRHVEECVPP